MPFGEGVVDFVRCFETLLQSGYRGPYLLEMWSEKADDPLRAVREARAWVVERMVEAGLEIRGACWIN